MCSLERSEKILSAFDKQNIIACRSLQKASQCQLNIPSTENRKKKKTKINFHERHLPKTLAFLGWYYILKIQCISSLVCCCQHLKSSNFVCFISLLSLVFQVILPCFRIFLPQKHLCQNSLVLLNCFTTSKIHLFQMFFYYTRG